MAMGNGRSFSSKGAFRTSLIFVVEKFVFRSLQNRVYFNNEIKFMEKLIHVT